MPLQKVAAVASGPATYVASGVAVLAGLTVSEWQAIGVVGGLILGALTFGTNYYFKHKHYKLEVIEMELRQRSGK